MHTVIIPLAQGQHAFSAETCCELAKGRMTHAAATPHVQNYPQYLSFLPSRRDQAQGRRGTAKAAPGTGDIPGVLPEGSRQPVTPLYLWVVFLG